MNYNRNPWIDIKNIKERLQKLELEVFGPPKEPETMYCTGCNKKRPVKGFWHICSKCKSYYCNIVDHVQGDEIYEQEDGSYKCWDCMDI